MITNMRAFISVFLFGICSLKASHIYETFSWATVGNPGNDGYTGWAPAGKVDYVFNISKYETTISQYATFLNSVASISDPYRLYRPAMLYNNNLGILKNTNSDGTFRYLVIGNGNKPIIASWFNAARFCNWLHNGGGMNADTEHGAYELNGAAEPVLISKNANAKYSIPTLPEWFKAAYYSPNKFGSGQPGYWLYATQSDDFDLTIINACFNYLDSDGTYLTPVGYFNAPSFYGTYDQTGNLDEWNDDMPHAGGYRGLRGGDFGNQAYGSHGRDRTYPDGFLNSSDNPTMVGFRIVTTQSNPQKYYVTLVLKFSTDLVNWQSFATNIVQTYNEREFYKADISVSTNAPVSP